MFIELKDLLKKFNLSPDKLLQREVIIKSTRTIANDIKAHVNQNAMIAAMDKYVEGQLKIATQHSNKAFYIAIEDVGFLPINQAETEFMIEQTKLRLASYEKLLEYLKSLPVNKTTLTWDDYVFHTLTSKVKEGEITDPDTLNELLLSLGIK